MSPPVVLLHGLARTHRSMNGLAAFLRREGFSPWAHTYPSRRLTIADAARAVEEQIRHDLPGQELFAVTHSLGGILLRHMPHLPWKRVVMLAPPNRGSRVARTLGQNPLFRWFYGPAGQEVSDAADWPAPTAPFAVIAGTAHVSIGNPTGWATKGYGIFQDDEPNDGTVAVAETRLPGMSAFRTVAASHTWIMNDAETRALIVAFLRTGELTPSALA